MLFAGSFTAIEIPGNGPLPVDGTKVKDRKNINNDHSLLPE